MHSIEPYYNWRHLYIASEDEHSPFYGREYSELEFTNQIYNYLIHPQWDEFGPKTLFLKILFTDYEDEYTIIELLGEWNDCINNDIMFLKRDIAELLMIKGIHKFIFIGENVLNFHASDDSYYEEWQEDVEDGWIAFVNFREHVLKEFYNDNIDQYFVSGGELDDLSWRTMQPEQFYEKVKGIVERRIN